MRNFFMWYLKWHSNIIQLILVLQKVENIFLFISSLHFKRFYIVIKIFPQKFREHWNNMDQERIKPSL